MFTKRLSDLVQVVWQMMRRTPPEDLDGDDDPGVRVPRPSSGPRLSRAAAVAEPDEDANVVVLARHPGA